MENYEFGKNPERQKRSVLSPEFNGTLSPSLAELAEKGVKTLKKILLGIER